MIGVDQIGQIRRAFFEHGRRIKEICRELRVSRATVRKVVRSEKTEFKYARATQPSPRLGEWAGVLTGVLEAEASLPRRERRSTQRLFEELRGRGYDGAHPKGVSIGREKGVAIGSELTPLALRCIRSVTGNPVTTIERILRTVTKIPQAVGGHESPTPQRRHDARHIVIGCGGVVLPGLVLSRTGGL